jgi:D-lactate dehydrogenase (cytochrome)
MDSAKLSELEWLGDRLVRDAEVLGVYGRDASYHAAAPPDAVAYPRNTAEVARIVRCCGDASIPLIPYGAGSSLEGGTLAPQGGLTVDLSRMNAIREVHVDDQDAVVEAGVTRLQLAARLEGSGLFFAVDPGADATLGGMASTGASGTTSVRYGTMRGNVLALEVVLADGRTIRTGSRARKSSAGYDLTRLFIGAEGTLGIVTELTLRLHPVPEAVAVAVGSFPAIKAAVRTVIEVIQRAIPVARAELLDGPAMSAVNRYAALDNETAPTLFFEFHGSQGAVEEQARQVQAIAKTNGGAAFRWSSEPEERARLWQARHDAFYAVCDLKPGVQAMGTDACVPISELAECIDTTLADRDRSSITAPLVGHVGDGNFHCIVLVDREDAEERRKIDAFHHRLIERALACGGTSTGEHGVGMGKREFLRREHGAAVDVMLELKRVLDPRNLLNPGKLFTDG